MQLSSPSLCAVQQRETQGLRQMTSLKGLQPSRAREAGERAGAAVAVGAAARAAGAAVAAGKLFSRPSGQKRGPRDHCGENSFWQGELERQTPLKPSAFQLWA